MNGDSIENTSISDVASGNVIISRTCSSRSERKRVKQLDRDNMLIDIIKLNGCVFNVFGSDDSIDKDIMVAVNNKISGLQPKELSRIRDLYVIKISELLGISANLIDINLVEVKYNVIVWQDHGTQWETNNALFFTYSLHEQIHPCFISSYLVPTNSDINKKLHRAVRIILSMYSRSVQYKNVVKHGLQAQITLRDRMNIIFSIDNTKNTWAEIYNNEMKKATSIKRACYQTLQALCCLNGLGLYTKSELAKIKPEIRCFLYRETPTPIDNINLNILFSQFVSAIEHRAKDKLINLDETEVLL